VKWADIVDGAQYEDARTAVEMGEPAIETHDGHRINQDPAFPDKLIAQLAQKPLADIIRLPSSRRNAALLDRHEKSIEIIRKHSECKDGTIYFDVTGYDLEGYTSLCRTTFILRVPIVLA